MKYTGKTEVCPVGMLLRHTDVDDLRSMELEDGRIYNVFNGYSHKIPWHSECHRVLQEPAGIRKLLASLISSHKFEDLTFALTSFSRQMDGRDANEVGAELSLNGMDASAVAVTRIRLESPQGSLNIRYFDDEVEAVLEQAATAPEARPEGTEIIDRTGVELPASVRLAVDKLLADGFRITCFLDALMSVIILRKGNSLKNIHAQLSWLR